MNKEFLQDELNRTNDWIQFADKKTGFLAVYYSVFIGYLITIKSILIEEITNSTCFSFVDILIIVTVGSIAFGVYQIFFSVFPSLINKNSKNSLFYFGYVATLTSDEYEKIFSSLSDEEICRHLREQIHTNSQIANKKMMHVKSTSKALFIIATLMLIIAIFV